MEQAEQQRTGVALMCCTIDCDTPAVYEGYRDGVEAHDGSTQTLLCRSCALKEEWPAAWLHLPGAEQSLEELGLRP